MTRPRALVAATITLAVTCLSAPSPTAQPAAAQPFDVLITGGRVVDGTGGAWFLADVGIRGDRIPAIGQLRDAATTTRIDARGLVVAPGFIDTGRRGAGDQNQRGGHHDAFRADRSS